MLDIINIKKKEIIMEDYKVIEEYTKLKVKIDELNTFLQKVKNENIMEKQIENNFMYHSPVKGQAQKYVQIRDKAKDFALFINNQCPNSREKSLAITKLEEAVMWANASIARNITNNKLEKK